MERKGIAAAGNWIVDKVKVIDNFPPREGLCNILESQSANGGAPYNVLKDLALLGFKEQLTGIGVIGNDADGTFILDDCHSFGIDTQFMHRMHDQGTSYTDVMSEQATGKRTFFHYRGANRALAEPHIPVEKLTCRIFHLGYLLLLDTLDEIREDGQTRAARVLASLQQQGITTSVDIVSENSDRFREIVSPSLPYTDYLFLNEYEASKVTGVEISNQADRELEGMKEAARELIDMGVNQSVFIHSSQKVLARTVAGREVVQHRVNLPRKMIRGAAGAGDAFAAGVLLALYQDQSLETALKWGVCSAAASLRHPGCSQGLDELQECLDLATTFGYAED